jgi:hypothetical protein
MSSICNQHHPQLECYQKLFINQINSAVTHIHGNFSTYFLKGRIIYDIEILGFIVGVYRHSNRTSYTGGYLFLIAINCFLKILVDDGTGSIICNIWFDNWKLPPATVELGSFVSIRGKLTKYNQEKRVTIEFIRKISSTCNI